GVFRALVTLVLWNHWPYSANVMPVIMVSCLEMAIVTAFAIFFSSFSTPVLSMIFTVLTFIAGRMSESFITFADFVQIQATRAANAANVPIPHMPFEYYLALGLAHVVPNLTAFGKAVETAVYKPTEGSLIWWGMIPYQILYTAGVLCLAMLIFQRRNF